MMEFNWRLWLGLALGGLLLVQTARLSDERAHHAQDIAKFQGERVESIRVHAKAETEQREEFERRIKEKDRVIEIAQQEKAAATAAAGRADAARLRRQQATDSLVDRARASCSNPQPGSGSAPAEDPIGVLADVLGRADERAGILAKYADAARIAGAACERQYQSLTPP